MPKKEEVVYTKPTSQVDLEQRLARDNESPLAVVQATTVRDPFGEEESAYVNVDPIYQNYANKTEKPLAAGSGPDKKAEQAYKDAVTVQKADEDRSGDNKPSGPYTDSSDQASAGAGSGSEGQGSQSAPFGEGDSSDDESKA